MRLLVGVLAAFLLVGCAAEEVTVPAPVVPATTGAGQFGLTERAFVELEIATDDQAVKLLDLGVSRVSGPLRELAVSIVDARRTELAALHGVLSAAGFEYVNNHEGHDMPGGHGPTVKGLLASQDGYTFAPVRSELGDRFAFTITGPNGAPVNDYEILHDRELHLILASRDLQHYAGLAGHGVGGGVDFADIVHPPHRDDDFAIMRGLAADQAGIAALRHQRDLVLAGELADRGNFGRGAGPQHQWRAAKEQVAFLGDIGRNIGRIGHRIFVADNSAKFRDQFRRERRYRALNDIHCRLLFHSRPIILVRPLRGAAGR